MKLYFYTCNWSPYGTAIHAKNLKHFWEQIAEVYKETLKGRNPKEVIHFSYTKQNHNHDTRTGSN